MLKKMLKKLFCRHRYKPISPEFCIGNGVMAQYCECEFCGKQKVIA